MSRNLDARAVSVPITDIDEFVSVFSKYLRSERAGEKRRAEKVSLWSLRCIQIPQYTGIYTACSDVKDSILTPCWVVTFSKL